MERYRRLMNADPANAARDINLTGSLMGQLRTANNRRNRAIRHAVVRTRAETGKAVSDVAVASKASGKAVEARS